MAIVAYGDESYNPADSGGYIISAWVADRDQWTDFCGRWQAALNDSGAPYLHMRELSEDAIAKLEPGQPFHGWTTTPGGDVDRFVNRMIPVIRNRAIFGITCAIESARYDEVPLAARGNCKSPYVFAFRMFFEAMLKVLSGETNLGWKLPANEQCSVIMDQVDYAVAEEAHRAFDQMKVLKPDAHKFGTLAFTPSRPASKEIASCHALPLQAADLLANRMFKRYKREIEKGDTIIWGWDRALKANENLMIAHLGKDRIIEFAEHVENMRRENAP
ncbi:MAG TPA: hypothetical protein VMV72_06705 [Verrucomicrobiae bacterium]|nr:hypothetical protein [Verrucomicrobiae bacterium]